MHLSTLRVPIDFGIDLSWSSVSFLISNLFFLLPNFEPLIHLRRFVCIYCDHRQGVFNTPHGSTHMLIPMHTDSVAPWTMKQSSCISEWDHWSSVSHWLGYWHWILQAARLFRHIIHTSHAEILHANIRQIKRQNNSKTAPISQYFIWRPPVSLAFQHCF